MERLKSLYSASRTLFFITGGLMFFFGFFMKSGMSDGIAPMFVLILDTPLLLFGLVYLVTGFRVRADDGESSLFESIVSLVAIVLFALFLFFQFAYPDLI